MWIRSFLVLFAMWTLNAEAAAPIYLTTVYPNATTTVYNAAWQPLPKSLDQLPRLPNGQPDYSHGYTFRNTAGGTYEDGTAFSSNSFVIVPPTQSSDFTKIFFGSPSQPDLQRTQAWYLWGTYGIRSSPGFTPNNMSVQIVVSADPYDSTDAPWAVLDSFTVTPGAPLPRSTPLGTWPLRKHFCLAIQVSTLGANNWSDNLVIDVPQFQPTVNRPSLGIAQSNLVWWANPDPTVVAISNQGASWLRTNMRDSSLAAKFADVVRTANQAGMAVVGNILQDPEDYVDPNGATVYANDQDFYNQCGYYGALKFSQIDIGKFTTRLQNHLLALQAAGAFVDTFELGNELDWVCFNGDLSLGTAVWSSSMAAFASQYGLALQAARTIINDYSPGSRLITFGAANCYTSSWGRNKGCILDPYQFLSNLAWLNHTNYLSYVDGYGVHLYEDPSSIWSARDTLITYSNYLGTQKNFWVTEWGFWAGSSRYASFHTFIEYMNETWWIPVAAVMLYTWSEDTTTPDGWVLDNNGTIDPAARIIGQYFQESQLGL